MSTTKPNFTPDAGGFIHHDEAKRLRDNYCNKKRQKDPHDPDFIQAYFFGKEKLQQLLDCQEDIIGLRIYFGDDHDHPEKELKKMVIYAVNHEGHNVHYKDSKAAKMQNLQNLQTGAAAPIEFAALDRGLPCPTNCPDQGTA
ncbi:hypothetical protein [Chitinophaga sp.]|uniref:hypothetical protein n=1 Tax=Chitinophaga sp. TaxID=1869181 RepID=UPI0031E0CBE1